MGVELLDWTPIGKTQSFQVFNSPLNFLDTISYVPSIRAVSSEAETGPSESGDGWQVMLNLVSQFPSNHLADVTGSIDGVCDGGGGVCSAREAILEALNVGPDQFVQLGEGQYDITAGEISIDKSITINGEGAGRTILNAHTLSRVISVTGANDVTVEIKNVTIMGGDAGSGGGVDVPSGSNANLILRDCAFIGNYQSSGGGSAVHFHGQNIEVHNCKFINNVGLNTSSVAGALGIHGISGRADILDSTFIGNRYLGTSGSYAGAALLVSGPASNIIVNIDRCSFVENYSHNHGGALGFSDSSLNEMVTVSNSTFFKNDSIANGGAVFVNSNWDVNFKGNSFINNTAQGFGAAIYNVQSVTLENNLFFKNYRGPDNFINLDSCGGSGSYSSLNGNMNDGTGCNLNVASNDYPSEVGMNIDSGYTWDGASPPYVEIFPGSSNVGVLSGCTGKDQFGNDRPANCSIGAIEPTDLGGPRSLIYNRSWVIAVKGQRMPDLIPVVDGSTPTLYTVTPSLPLGISIDSSTGVISGTGFLTFTPGVKYTVVAENVFGKVATTVNIRVEDAYVVDTTSMGSDANLGDGVCADTAGNCTLIAALQEVDFGSPLSSVNTVYLPNNSYFVNVTLPTANGDLNIIGESKTGTIINLSSQSSLLNLGTGSTDRRFHLSDLNFQYAIMGVLKVGLNSRTKVSHVTFDNNDKPSGGAAIDSISGYTVLDVEFSDFTNNTSFSGDGGAIDLGTSSLSLNVRYSSFQNNQCLAASCKGGAIAGHNIEVYSSLFEANNAQNGGAIYCYNDFRSVLENSSFHNNSALTGGALYKDGPGQLIGTNNTFTNNIAANVTGGGALSILGGRVMVGNNIFENNMSNGAPHSCQLEGSGSQDTIGGNITDEPVWPCDLRSVSGDVQAQGLSFTWFSGIPQPNSTPGFPRRILIDPSGGAVGIGRQISCPRLDSSGKLRRQGTEMSLGCNAGATQ